jgi:hypothetical protein
MSGPSVYTRLVDGRLLFRYEVSKGWMQGETSVETLLDVSRASGKNGIFISKKLLPLTSERHDTERDVGLDMKNLVGCPYSFSAHS